MKLADISRLAAELDGVTERVRDGLLDFGGTGAALVARQLDDRYIVIRASFHSRFSAPVVPRDVLGAQALRRAHDDRR